MPLIHNQGRKVGDKHIARKVIYPKDWDEKGHPVLGDDGKPITEEINPGKHKNVTDAQYKHLKGLLGDEIVNIDDVRDMQNQFTEKKATERPAGYLSPQEVENEKEKAVKEALAAHNKDKDPNAKKDGQEDRVSLAQRIDALDRSELVALIEKEKLDVPHKSVQIDKLKAAILAALEARSKGEEEEAA